MSLPAGSNNFGQNRSKAGAVFAYPDDMLANRSFRQSEIWETNAGKRWDTADLFFLVSAFERGLSIEEVGGFLRRPASEVQEKARELQAGRRRTALQWKKGHRG
jgi:hypothetical protein